MPNSLPVPDRIEIRSGPKTAVFLKSAEGWQPDWFREGDRPMLRFKDHEWLSIGHLHPTAASEARKVRGGYAFRGETLYGGARVEWEVRVLAEPARNGFRVESSFRPDKAIELMEAFASFETPYEYDGTERATTVIGQNPITQWDGNRRVSPPQWSHPFWSYNRPEVLHMTGMCNAPYVCQAVSDANGGNARYTTLVGEWAVCAAHDIFVTPTRTVAADDTDWGENAKARRRGYKFIVGAVNWSSAMAEDPNVLYPAGRRQRQRVFLSYSGAAPGGSMDRQLMAAWETAAACDLPADGRVAAWDEATRRGVSWRAAAEWLRGVFLSDRPTAGLFDPGQGIATYADGTRPKAGGYGWDWWPQWAGPLHYRALAGGDDALAARCEQLDGRFADAARKRAYGMMTAPIVGITALPSLWWAAGRGRGGPLAEALRPAVEETWKRSCAENGTARDSDAGVQATRAEGLLLAAEAYGEPRYAEQALRLAGEINARLDGNFWEFGCTKWSDTMHGGQVRPMGYGHAITANLLAWRRTGQAAYREAARRFARLLVSVNYMTHNGSPVSEMDFRGWANGTTGGRDQHAEMPPWETANSLLCLAALLGEEDLEPGCLDVLWYFARTGLCQFPAARRLKRVWDPAMQRTSYVPRERIASEGDFYDPLPYLAYENPHDQTLLASYQGTDGLLIEAVLGGGLAQADDDRLAVIVPRAAVQDAAEMEERRAVVWNPMQAEVRTTVRASWPGGASTSREFVVPPRQIVRLALPHP